MRFGKFRLDLDLWLRGWIALQRIFWATVVLVAHAGNEYCTKLLFTQEFQHIQKLYIVITEVTLLSLNAWLLVEAVRVFLPTPWGISIEE